MTTKKIDVIILVLGKEPLLPWRRDYRRHLARAPDKV